MMGKKMAKRGTTAVAKPQPTLKDWLQSDAFKSEVTKALPHGKDADQMIRTCISAVARTPMLQQCDQTSFLTKVLELAEWGLSANGRDAHLIPFRNNKKGIVEVQLILDYKGLIQLLYRSNLILSVHADVVHEGDLFHWQLGEVTAHTPWKIRRDVQKPQQEGEVYAAYVRVVLKGGATKCEVMSKDEIAKIRSRSKAATSGPWVTDWKEMAKKTVFKRASKWLPLSPEIIAAMGADYDNGPPVGTVVTGGGPVVEQPTTLGQLADKLTPGTAQKLMDQQEEAKRSPEPPQEPQESPVDDASLIKGYRDRIRSAASPADLGPLLKEIGEDPRVNDLQYEEIESLLVKREQELM